MEFHFLGTGSGVPSTSRNVSALAVRFLQKKDIWLFDCGEATQHQLLKSSITLSKISHIFITHLHGDHIYGLPGLLSTRSAQGGHSPLTIFGPKEIKDYIETTFTVSKTVLSYPIHYVFIDDGFECFEQGITIQVKKLNHVIDSYAYKLIEEDKPGPLLVDKLMQIGLTPGPIYKEIKENSFVELPNGNRLLQKDFVGPKKKGRTVVIAGDTKPVKNFESFISSCDLLIHEGTFLSDRKEQAELYGHSTIEDVTRMAKEANVGMLILTHISSRYVDMDDELEQVAKRIFSPTMIASDYFIYTLRE